jgi:predicted DNA-binding transcriptional regulator AlpA
MSLTTEEKILSLRLRLAQEKKYLDMKDVMVYSGYSRSTIHRRISEGVLKPFQHCKGARLFFNKESVENMIEGGLL